MDLGVILKFVNVLDNCQFLMDGCVNKFDHLQEAGEVLLLEEEFRY
jgi:hypothetical protein